MRKSVLSAKGARQDEMDFMDGMNERDGDPWLRPWLEGDTHEHARRQPL